MEDDIKFNINKLISDAGEKICDEFRRRETAKKYDFPSVFIPVLYQFELYVKVPIDELGVNGVPHSEIIKQTSIYIDRVKLPPPPEVPLEKPTSICLNQ
jgi:hypothetical protein